MKQDLSDEEDWMKPFAAGGIRAGGQPAKAEAPPLET